MHALSVFFHQTVARICLGTKKPWKLFLLQCYPTSFSLFVINLLPYAHFLAGIVFSIPFLLNLALLLWAPLWTPIVICFLHTVFQKVDRCVQRPSYSKSAVSHWHMCHLLRLLGRYDPSRQMSWCFRPLWWNIGEPWAKLTAPEEFWTVL